MSQQQIPQLAVIETAFAPDISVKVDEVHFSSAGLNVLVTSQSWRAKTIFPSIHGFRVLDEGDLSEFWSECSLKDSWLFEVKGGGWKSLELSRPHFVSGLDSAVREFLIIGFNECVSVLAQESPMIIEATQAQ